MAIFTDGIDEAFNARDEMFGIERFNEALLAGRELPVAVAGAGLFETLADFSGGTPQSDDICLMLLDITFVNRVSCIDDHVQEDQHQCHHQGGDR